MLPAFKYHPDPIATGTVVESETVCECCEKARGYVYVGPVYAVEELVDCICPWCIADGSAHSKFDASFVDIDGIGGYGAWEAVTRAIAEEVAFRTPGFPGWQQERWWTHCADAGEFVGAVGKTEAKALGEQFLEHIRAEAGLEGESEWINYLAALDVEHGPTAYAFRCRHCGKLGGYSDTD